MKVRNEERLALWLAGKVMIVAGWGLAIVALLNDVIMRGQVFSMDKVGWQQMAGIIIGIALGLFGLWTDEFFKALAKILKEDI